MPTLRVTWEAKNQLQQILTSVGFPEETVLPIHVDNTGPDPKLDVVMALMCYGLYPNVCYHKEKRKVGIIMDYCLYQVKLILFFLIRF